MSVLIDSLQAAGVNDPAWLVLSAVLLGIAGAVARRQGKSARSQGARVGRLERRADSERIRRLQLEDVMRCAGLRLPVWPDDPQPLEDDVDQELDDVDPNPPTYRLPTQDFTRHALRKDPR